MGGETEGGVGVKITDALLGEHGVFYAQFDHLEQLINSDAALSELQSGVATLTAGLATHAAIEDEVFFTALEPFLGSTVGPIAAMRAEHDIIERNMGLIPSAPSLAQARQLLSELLNVARSHFVKEEHVLFPMAQRVLDEDTLLELGAQWAERRKIMLA